MRDERFLFGAVRDYVNWRTLICRQVARFAHHQGNVDLNEVVARWGRTCEDVRVEDFRVCFRAGVVGIFWWAFADRYDIGSLTPGQVSDLLATLRRVAPNMDRTCEFVDFIELARDAGLPIAYGRKMVQMVEHAHHR